MLLVQSIPKDTQPGVLLAWKVTDLAARMQDVGKGRASSFTVSHTIQKDSSAVPEGSQS